MAWNPTPQNPWNPMAVAALGMGSPQPQTRGELQRGVDAAFQMPIDPSIDGLAARLSAEGRQQAQPQVNAAQFAGTGYDTGGETNPLLDQLGAAQARKDQQARSIMQPAVPQPGAVGAGARAQFYSGGQQSGQTNQVGMALARGKMAEAGGVGPEDAGDLRAVDLNVEQTSRATTPDGQAADRAATMRGSPLYQKMLAARKAANAASVPGAAPQDSELPAVRMTGARPEARVWSDEEKAGFAANKDKRAAKAEEIQGRVTDKASIRGMARLGRQQGVNPPMISPMQRDMMAWQEGQNKIAADAGVEAARVGQQGSEAFDKAGQWEAYNKIDQSTPEGRRQAKEFQDRMALANTLRDGAKGVPPLGPQGRIAPPQAGQPGDTGTADKHADADTYVKRFQTDRYLPKEVLAEGVRLYGREAMERALQNKYSAFSPGNWMWGLGNFFGGGGGKPSSPQPAAPAATAPAGPASKPGRREWRQ